MALWVLLSLVLYGLIWDARHFPKIVDLILHQGLLKSKALLSDDSSHNVDLLSENFALFEQPIDEIPGGVDIKLIDNGVESLFFIYAFQGDRFKSLRLNSRDSQIHLDGHFTFDTGRSTPLPVSTTFDAPEETKNIHLHLSGNELTVRYGSVQSKIEIEDASGEYGLVLYPPDIGMDSVSLWCSGENKSLKWYLRMILLKIFLSPILSLLVSTFLAASVLWLIRGNILRSIMKMNHRNRTGPILWIGTLTLVGLIPLLRNTTGSLHPYFIFALQGVQLIWMLFFIVLARSISKMKPSRFPRILYITLLLCFFLLPVAGSGLIMSMNATSDHRAEMMVEKLQFRDIPELPPKSDDFVILCLGGSSTEGAPFDANWSYDYPHLLEKMLKTSHPNVRVFNAGISACSSWDALEYAPALIEKIRPEIVIFSYFENDLVVQKLNTLRERLLPDFLERIISPRPHHEVIHSLSDICKKTNATPVFLVEPIYEWVNGKKANLDPVSREGLD